MRTKLFLGLLIAPFAVSCSYIFSDEKSETPVEPGKQEQASEPQEAAAVPKASHVEKEERVDEPKKTSQPSNVSEMDLKQAKMWARIDELEGSLAEEKQKVALLERGMKTGIIPDELRKKRTEPSESKKKPEEKKQPVVELAKDFKDIESDISKKTDDSKRKAQEQSAKKLSEDEMRLRIAKAQDLYRAGSFGAALAELGAIQREQGDTSDGAVSYWTGRNWIALKEFQTGITKLTAFASQFPTSPYVGRAKLEIARAQNQLGLKNRAVQTLQELIKTHPTEESAEMAQMELERMKKTL